MKINNKIVQSLLNDLETMSQTFSISCQISTAFPEQKKKNYIYNLSSHPPTLFALAADFLHVPPQQVCTCNPLPL